MKKMFRAGERITVNETTYDVPKGELWVIEGCTIDKRGKISIVKTVLKYTEDPAKKTEEPPR